MLTAVFEKDLTIRAESILECAKNCSKTEMKPRDLAEAGPALHENGALLPRGGPRPPRKRVCAPLLR